MPRIENIEFAQNHGNIIVLLFAASAFILVLVSIFLVDYLLHFLDGHILENFYAGRNNFKYVAISIPLLLYLLQTMFPVLLYRRLGRHLKPPDYTPP